MDIGAVDLVGVSDPWLALEEGQEFICGHSLNADIGSLTIHVLAVCYAALNAVPSGAA